MTPQSINTAIAESLGWDMDPVETREWGSRGQWCVWRGTMMPKTMLQRQWCVSRGTMTPKTMLPNYHSSLDACAEFEATLTTPFDKNCYAALVFDQLSEVDQTGELDFCMITATAPQRCEAYLKLKGLWKEGAK